MGELMTRYCGIASLSGKCAASAVQPWLLGTDGGIDLVASQSNFTNKPQVARTASTATLAARYVRGRRTSASPSRCQRWVVNSRRGATQPRRPASTKMAGSSVNAASTPTPTVMASAGPTVESSPSLAKLMHRNVTATVAPEAATTLPTLAKAATTAASELDVSGDGEPGMVIVAPMAVPAVSRLRSSSW